MRQNQPFDLAHRPAADFTSRPPHFAPDAPLLVSCIRCGRLLSAVRPFEFNPVCAVCAGRLGSLAQ
jgi:hypothetical protein